MPDVTPPSRSNPLPARPCSIIGIWSQLAACPSSLSPDSGSPSPVPACPTVRVQGSRHPPGSGLHRSGLRGQWAQGSVPLRRHAAAPRRPERWTPGASDPRPHPLVACAAAPQWQSPPPPTTVGCRKCEDRQLQCVNSYCDFLLVHLSVCELILALPAWRLGCSATPPISWRSEDHRLTDRWPESGSGGCPRQPASNGLRL
jgi:hypothetical protein